MFMQFIKDNFRTLKLSYLIRQYFFGLIILGAYQAFTPLFFDEPTQYSFYLLVYYIFIGVNFLLYPFATLVWDEIKNLIMGNNVFFVNAIALLIAKLIIKLFIFGFSVPIGLIGILYLWIVRKNAQNNQ